MTALRFDCRHRYASGFELAVTFEVDDGVSALFGPSGSGKSTILGLIAGLMRPQSGRIELAGQVLFDHERRICLPPEERRIGMVFQEQLLFPHRTVRQNLSYGSSRRPARNIAFERVAAILEIGDLLDRYPHTLSGGQRQRVALGRALLRGPHLLLMDEPLAALDQALKDRVLTYLERVVAEWRIPTLFVSHDQTDVRRLANHVIIVEAGRVIGSGPTRATLDRALLTLSSHPAPVNLLRVTDVGQVEGHWQGRVGGQAIHLPAEAAYVQFLPQDVILARETVAGLSVRNQLSGQVRELVTLGDRVFVAVDVGQFLWAEVTPAAVRELAIQPGQPVVCLIKATAIHVLR